MDTTNLGHSQHISKQFNAELTDVRSRVLAMGGLVEKQIHEAVTALVMGDKDLAMAVINGDLQVNAFEVDIDEECAQILARRQPTASDLRLIVAIIKTITDLERIGDQAEKVARMGLHLAELERPKTQYVELQSMGERVLNMVRGALDAFARTDVEAALQVVKSDVGVDQEYDAISRQMITFMMEDPRAITRSLDVLWAARALERVGDHTRNMCEYIIYLVKGKDVRHVSLEQLEQAALEERS